MTIVRWQPFGDLLSLQERMNQLLDESFRGQHTEDDWTPGGSWAPLVDIYEQEGDLFLQAELPGVDPKAVDVRVEDNVLTLRGERRAEAEVKRDRYHRMERSYGKFSRSFTLPSAINTEKIQAEYKDGVLRLTLPKKEEAKPKQITISTK